jgi:hypothetical protein
MSTEPQPPDPVDEMVRVLTETLAANALRLTTSRGGYVGGGQPHATVESDPGATDAIARGLLARKVAEPSRTLDAARAVPALERCAPYGNPHPNGEPCPDCIAYGYAARAVPALDAARMTHAWAILTSPTGSLPVWEPDRYNAAAFVTALLEKYAALSDQQSKGDTSS